MVLVLVLALAPVYIQYQTNITESWLLLIAVRVLVQLSSSYAYIIIYHIYPKYLYNYLSYILNTRKRSTCPLPSKNPVGIHIYL